MKIWSKYCDDPTSMIILDPDTGIVYTQEEAELCNPEIRKRLVNHCTRQGYYVEDFDWPGKKKKKGLTHFSKSKHL